MSKKSLFEKVTLSNRRLNPKALALLDVLIGMAIFALIAVIAVIALGQFRQRAFQTGAVEDARSLGLVVESSSTNTGAYPATLSGTAPTTTARKSSITIGSSTTTLTADNHMEWYVYFPPTGTRAAGFALCVEHRTQSDGAQDDAHAVYSSLRGGIVAQSDQDGCPATYTNP